MENLKFLTEDQVRKIGSDFGTPIFVYSEMEIEKRCDETLEFPNAYGVTVRYAMKANSNSSILNILRNKGIKIDASSEYEVERALMSGYKPADIMLTSQQHAKKLKSIVKRGIFFNACSLRQLEEFGKLFPGHELSIRINPGLGSGSTTKTNVGGVTSSFGIWYERITEVQSIVSKYNLKITKIHTHIGSGSDPDVWKAVAKYTLEYAEIFKECTVVNLGGGFKVARMQDEKSVDLQKVGKPVKELFEEFYNKHNRKLHLEIEPGTYMMANCGSVISTIDDIVNTGKNGYDFIKLDSGMDVNTRPSLYGSRHPLISVSKNEQPISDSKEYIVVGHCCESGDLFTQKMGGEHELRTLNKSSIGDYIVMEGTGAYCSSMSTKNYNSYPESPEVLIDKNNQLVLIRKKQTLDQMLRNEIFR